VKVGDLVKNVLHNQYGIGVITMRQRSGLCRNKIFRVFWIKPSPVHPSHWGEHWDYDLEVINNGCEI